MTLILSLIFSLECASSSYHFTFAHTNDVHGYVNLSKQVIGVDASFADAENFFYTIKQVGHDNVTNFAYIIDSGDFIEGTAYSDLSTYKGELNFALMNISSYDVVTFGNHELQNQTNFKHIHSDITNDNFKPKYLYTNLYNTSDNNTSTKYDKHYYHSIDHPALGVITFLGLSTPGIPIGDPNALFRSDTMENTFSRPEIQNLLKDDSTKMFVLICHFDYDESDAIQMEKKIKAIRAGMDTDVPFVCLMGHTHQIQAAQRGQFIYMQSGHYLSSIGVMEFDIVISTEEGKTTREVKNPFFSNVFMSRFELNKFFLDHYPHVQKNTESNSADNVLLATGMAVDDVDRLIPIHFIGHNSTQTHSSFRSTENGGIQTSPNYKAMNDLISAFHTKHKLEEIVGYNPSILRPDFSDKVNSLHAKFVNEIYPTVNPRIPDKKSSKNKDHRIYIMNEGGVRAIIPRGDLTQVDLVAVDPFGNQWHSLTNVKGSKVNAAFSREMTTNKFFLLPETTSIEKEQDDMRRLHETVTSRVRRKYEKPSNAPQPSETAILSEIEEIYKAELGEDSASFDSKFIRTNVTINNDDEYDLFGSGYVMSKVKALFDDPSLIPDASEVFCSAVLQPYFAKKMTLSSWLDVNVGWWWVVGSVALVMILCAAAVVVISCCCCPRACSKGGAGNSV
ncbi:hypothetical protein BLNAU_14442 [Blattamonas nauphoetae]|uniref:Calcineurin-like phosphoesterase domain-containing protein n=1 Tax=Blattamonas nauphoetae TaxID=2049346 RepID=A0ABQ9XK57_9EUKA|nr:hypothetical protein BLNAU_14442 [Blattamonas nauphoetae]